MLERPKRVESICVKRNQGLINDGGCVGRDCTMAWDLSDIIFSGRYGVRRHFRYDTQAEELIQGMGDLQGPCNPIAMFRYCMCTT